MTPRKRTSRPSIREAALAYANKGWHVLPLVPQAKNPLTKMGLLNASANPDIIEVWWDRWPNANVGLRTGIAFDVLDIDGEVGYASMSKEAGPVKHTGPVSHTGRGEHWLFAPTGTANRAGLLEKIDWRGVNGYIVAPPSVHPDGHLYAWNAKLGRDKPLPETPQWITDRLVLYQERSAAPEINVKIIEANPFDPKATTHTLNPYQLAVLRFDIVATAEALGMQPKKKGRLFVVRCPYHAGDNEESLTLYPDNRFYCFGCDSFGTVIDLQRGTARKKYAGK